MISFEFKRDIDRIKRNLTETERRQVPFASMQSINDAGFHTMNDLRDLARQTFHMPLSWTIKQIRYRRTKDKRNPSGLIYIDTEAKKVFRHHIESGGRQLKRYEWLLQRKGILPQGQHTIPAKRLLNANGNIKKSELNKIISGVQAFTEAGFTANRTARSGRRKTNRYFVANGTGATSHLAPGIYEVTTSGRRRGSLQPALLFIDSPTYKKRYDFYKYAERRAIHHFRQAFPGRLAAAVATRKK